MNTQLALVLPPSAASNTAVINARCTLRREEEQCVIVVAGLPLHHYRADDAVAQAYAMESGPFRVLDDCNKTGTRHAHDVCRVAVRTTVPLGEISSSVPRATPNPQVAVSTIFASAYSIQMDPCV